jgi:hypothetical protein
MERKGTSLWKVTSSKTWKGNPLSLEGYSPIQGDGSDPLLGSGEFGPGVIGKQLGRPRG